MFSFHFWRRFSACAVIALLCAFTLPTLQGRQQNRRIPGRQVTEEDLFRWVSELNNWGRWGQNDGKGASNFITPTKRVQAAGLVKLGITVSMERNVLQATDPGATGSVLTRTVTTLSASNAQDQYAYTGSYHGNNHSHWDALCHWYAGLGGKLYNGGLVSEQIDPVRGCLSGDIMAHKDGVLTRGILFDATAYLGVEWLAPSTPIYWEDLEAMERLQGVRVQPGDAIFLHTGRWKRQAAGQGTNNAAGYHASVAQFLKDRGVAFIGSEMAQDVQPGGFPGFSSLPVHTLAIGVLGIGSFDALDLDELAATARRLRRYEFMFTAAPLRVVGGTGGPINPIATF
jgi:kynurenine formamidase